MTALLIPVYRLQGLSWTNAIVAAVLFVAPCAAFGWIIWRLLMRRGRAMSWYRAALRHAATALAFSTAWTAVFIWAVYMYRAQALPGFLREGAVWQFARGVIIYAILAQAARAQRQLRERELAAARAELQALRAQLIAWWVSTMRASRSG